MSKKGGTKGKGKGTRRRSSKSSSDDDLVVNSDSGEEFGEFGPKVLPTSNKTLNEFQLPTDSEQRKILKQMEQKHELEKKELKKQYESEYAMWHSDLFAGNNIMFYGCGSKISLIDHFVKHSLSKYPVLQVFGYMPNCNVKSVASHITENLLGMEVSFPVVGEHCEYIHNLFSGTKHRRHTKNSITNTTSDATNKENLPPPEITPLSTTTPTSETTSTTTAPATTPTELTDTSTTAHTSTSEASTLPTAPASTIPPTKVREKNSSNIPSRSSIRHGRPIASKSSSAEVVVPPHLIIVVHNIDGPNLRSKQAQNALALLASAKNIHMIASIDTMNAPIAWDLHVEHMFSWAWIDITTFDLYPVELAFRSTELRGSAPRYAKSVDIILSNLTENARAIFRVLATHQLESGTNKVGMGFNALFSKCRDMFIVSSEITLRAQLIEFKEHHVIKEHKDNTLYIPLDIDTLQQLVENKNTS